MKRRIIFALILMGFTSLVAQALLIREFLISFYGNEFTIGLILACWIISEALGSWFASRFSDKSKSPFLIYALLQGLIAIYLPVSIFLIRSIKNILPTVPGEALGIVPMVISCAICLGPLSIFDGMLFPFGCRIYGQQQKEVRQTPGRVYILEAVGFIIAGPMFTYLFLTRLYSFQIVLLIGLINLISGLFLIKEDISSSLKKFLGISISILIVLNLYCLFSNTCLKFHRYSIARQWKNQTLLEYKNSIYGNLAVTQKREQYTFYSNGIPIINIPTPDIFTTEEFVHFGLLSHPNPKNILFLSGGAGGPISEALKHPVNRIDYAELDPTLIKLLKKYPKDITEKELNDKRVNLNITDGVCFAKTTHLRYDVIFINLPFPSTLQLNRYYTKEFFIQIKKILNPDGQLVLSLPGSLSYLSEELKQLNLCIMNTLKDEFPNVFVIPGYSNIYISSISPLEINPQIFAERIKERAISTNVLTQPNLEYRLKKYWQDWFYDTIYKKDRIKNQGLRIKENRNLAPSGVFYGISYWNALFNPYLKGFFRALNKLNFTYIIFFVITCEILLLIARVPSVAASIATTGFIGMSLNLIFIFSYQIFFGYIYHHIALLVTSFMTGLMVGGWLITKNLQRLRKGLSWFIAIEIVIVSFCLCSGIFLIYLNEMRAFNFYALFYILSGLTGFLVGSEFPLANKLYGKSPGVLYALDLVGAFFSALLVSIVLLPIFGVVKTCILLAILKSAGLILYFPRPRPLR